MNQVPASHPPRRRSIRRRAVLLAAGVGVLALLSSCADVRYLAQAAGGQLDLLVRARPVADVLNDPATPAETRRKLELVGQVRAFAVQDLGLPDHGAFLKYVNVGRPAVVWNVFSAPEFSVSLRTSCFPVAGCVGYRGYFAEADAQAYARSRREAGDDVVVGGVSAYSTLGYLRDPVLSTMLAGPDTRLIRTVIHELAHPSLYVADDTIFNESFAVTIEEEGMRRWLARPENAALREQDRLTQQRQDAFERLLLDTRAELERLYVQTLPPEQMRQAKEAVFEGMRERYAGLKADWGGYNGYDGWLARGVNNASLGAVAAYSALVPDFQRLLARVGSSLPAFIEGARVCAALPWAERPVCLRGD